ncbi:sulfatase-like hydrolase/transferase [Planctopirus hydrillae]|uniref:Sulfatase N-terminal domain-containing protein n=1 Tax=Planctopirus hydrillae TaxID=1841610 RepID=A0A1C3E831_9PLAN|nr:sulfatase-like hydrolase/transferase [Planctopirus hydrillae]ODA29405.1 hypothetical protein A6X21_08935 [Planctopirus hydrillae]
MRWATFEWWRRSRGQRGLGLCSLLIWLVSCGVLISPTSSEAQQPARPQRPNIMVLLADDAGWGDYSSSGNPYVKTPHIDSIAQQGVSLSNFYVCPVCSPTRAEFLTGRYALRTGVRGVSLGEERLNLDEQTIAEHFRKAGYRTGIFGKWHNGSQGPYHPLARGFDVQLGYTAGHWSEYIDAPLESQGQPVTSNGYIVDTCMQAAIDFISSSQPPFFCYVPLTTPHSPWCVPQTYWNRWKDRDVGVHGKEADAVRCVYAMIEQQDDAVGRLLAHLDSLRLSSNTIVLYFSDNGPNTVRWNGEMRGRKGTVDEGGVRSVGYLRWPGHIPPGSTQSGLMGAIDLLPTLAGLANIPLDSAKPIDGIDISTALLKNIPVERQQPLLSHWAGKFSLRSPTHRLDFQGRLYDMQHDRSQNFDLSTTHPEIASVMRQQLARLQTELSQPPATSQQSAQLDTADILKSPWLLPVHKEFLAHPPQDSRLYPVGYVSLPYTWLPARDGQPLGKIQRSSNAPNSSYFTNWNDDQSAVIWPVEVLTSGTYRIELESTSPATAIGSELEISFQDSKLSVPISEAHDPPTDTRQDTIPRPKAETLSKPFRRWQAGSIQLPSGPGLLTIRATQLKGSSIIDLKSINLILEEQRP